MASSLPACISARYGKLVDVLTALKETDRRVRLFQRLEELVHKSAKIKLIKAIIVDGSFVTAELRPNDIDLVLVVTDNFDFADPLAVRVQRNVIASDPPALQV
jgi:hypothetical protein